jgi:hypothetical protein
VSQKPSPGFHGTRAHSHRRNNGVATIAHTEPKFCKGILLQITVLRAMALTRLGD